MKNMLGEERQPQPLTFEWGKSQVLLVRGGHYIGHGCINGFNGVALIHHPVGEFILTQLNGSISASELRQLIEAAEEKLKL